MTDDASSSTADAAAGTPRHRGRRAVKFALFTLIAWALFAVLLEAAVRLLVPAPARSYHRWLGTHIRPGARVHHASPRDPPEFDRQVVFNRQGFHDVEHAARKEPGTLRIVVLGDSIVEAREVAVEQNFCRLLEAQLNQGRGAVARRCEVINCGISGAGPLLCCLVLRHIATAQDADLVLMVCFPNDPADDLRFEGMVQRDSSGRPYRIPTPQGNVPLPAGVKELLRRHSRAWSFLGTTVTRAWRRLKGHSEAAAAGTARDDFFAARDADSPRSQQGWQLLGASIGDLNDLARERGARFGLVAVPLGHQIRSRPEWEPGRKVHNLSRGEGAAFQRRLGEISRANDIPFLDLLPPFEAAEGATLYFPYDGHLRPQGHAVAAHVIAGWIKQASLLPGHEQ